MQTTQVAGRSYFWSRPERKKQASKPQPCLHSRCVIFLAFWTSINLTVQWNITSLLRGFTMVSPPLLPSKPSLQPWPLRWGCWSKPLLPVVKSWAAGWTPKGKVVLKERGEDQAEKRHEWKIWSWWVLTCFFFWKVRGFSSKCYVSFFFGNDSSPTFLSECAPVLKLAFPHFPDDISSIFGHQQRFSWIHRSHGALRQV